MNTFKQFDVVRIVGVGKLTEYCSVHDGDDELGYIVAFLDGRGLIKFSLLWPVESLAKVTE